MPAASPRLQRGVRRARWSVGTVFFVNGATLASWIPHIPAVKARHGFGDGTLGLVLLAMAVGAITAMPLTGRAIGRIGSRMATVVACLGLGLALPLPILAPSPLALVAALLLLGACNGALDVSMNAQAAEVERRHGRAIMSSFHALFSLGGLAGAAAAGAIMARGVGDVRHVVGAAAAALAVSTIALRGLLPSPPDPTSGPTFARLPRALLAFGTIAFFGLLAEGAIGDWSAVYLRESLGTSPAFAAAGFAAFSLAMTAGRFAGDALVGRFGPRRVLRASAVLAAGGLGAALVIGRPLPAVLGCTAVGLGIANIIPVLFSNAANVPGVPPGTALAAVATTGYFGFLAGPALIGLTAEVTSLPTALGLVSFFCGLIALLAGTIGRSAPGQVAAAVGLPLAAGAPDVPRDRVR